MTVYATGLRTSETVALPPEDIDTGTMTIHVRQGRGRQDRIVPLSGKLLEALRHYWRVLGMHDFIFPGRDASTPLSRGWVQNMTRSAARRASLPSGVTPRTLRPCYATHLLENGTDLRVIQRLIDIVG